MPYVCDNHPDQPGALIVTNLANGDTQTVCGPDVHALALAMADATAPDGYSVQVISDAMLAQLAAAESAATPEPEAGESASADDDGDDGDDPGFSDDDAQAAREAGHAQADVAAQDDAGAPEPQSVGL